MTIILHFCALIVGRRVWMRLSVHCQGACPSASSSRISHAFLGNHKQPADAASLSMAERAILHRKGGAQYRLVTQGRGV